MTVFTENGYFEKGAFVRGLHPTMIGKIIIRTDRCLCHYGYDGSYSMIDGRGIPNNPEYEYVRLYNVYDDGRLLIEWNPRMFPRELSVLSQEWNDGKWVEYTPKEALK